MIKQILAGGLALLLLLGLSGGMTEREIGPNEFVIQVGLDTEDEVYVLSCAYMLDGELTGSVAVCNADERTPLRGAIYECFQAEDFPEGADLSGFSVRFWLRNSMDGEDIPVDNEIRIPVEYMNEYAVRIAGSRESGYRAE